jgi:hypothetical protein
MPKNGTTVKLTPEEKAELKRKIATYNNTKQFCLANNISAPLLENPLLRGKCSEKTYKRLVKWKAKEE